MTGDLPARATIVDGFRRTTTTHTDRAALRWWSGAGWSSLPWADYRRAVDDVANGLLRWHLEPGERVAILASNRPEWHITDLAILSAGLVTVPIYPTSSAGQVAYCSGTPVLASVSPTRRALTKILLLRQDIPGLKGAVMIGTDPIPRDGFVVMFDDVRREGSLRAGSSTARCRSSLASIRPDDLATIVHTSGTTGLPKGVMITHGNLMAALRSLTSYVDIGPDDRFLSFLPLSHVTERTISHFGQIIGRRGDLVRREVFTTVGADLRAPAARRSSSPYPGCGRRCAIRSCRASRISDGRHDAIANRYVGDLRSLDRGHLAAAQHAALDIVVGRTIRRRLGLDQARVLDAAPRR